MANIAMTQKESIVDQLEELHQRIARRAHDLFRGRDDWGDPFGDWVTAERELVWKPAVELREQDGRFTLQAVLPGVEAKDIKIDITPQEVLIKAATEHEHTVGKSQIHRCEFTAGQIFRSVPFPRPVEVAKAKADYQNGLLNLTVPMAPEAPAKRGPSGVDRRRSFPPWNERPIASVGCGRPSRPNEELQQRTARRVSPNRFPRLAQSRLGSAG